MRVGARTVVVFVALQVLVLATGCLSQERSPSQDPAPASSAERSGEAAAWAKPAKELRFDGIRKPAAVLPEISLKAGDVRYFDGTLGVRTSVPALLGGQIRCGKGKETWASGYTTRNTSNEPDYVDFVRVRWMFKAPADGTYRCALYGHADHKKQPDNFTMRVVGAPDTRLEMLDEPISAGLRWPIERDLEVTRPRQIGLLRKGFEAVSVAKELDVLADVEVTANYEGRLHDYDSHVLLNLTVEQLDRSGRPCGQSWSASGRMVVTREVHHAKVTAQLPDIPVRTERTCTRQFAVQGGLELASGAPLTVHGKEYSDITVLMR